MQSARHAHRTINFSNKVTHIGFSLLKCKLFSYITVFSLHILDVIVADAGTYHVRLKETSHSSLLGWAKIP